MKKKVIFGGTLDKNFLLMILTYPLLRYTTDAQEFPGEAFATTFLNMNYSIGYMNEIMEDSAKTICALQSVICRLQTTIRDSQAEEEDGRPPEK